MNLAAAISTGAGEVFFPDHMHELARDDVRRYVKHFFELLKQETTGDEPGISTYIAAQKVRYIFKQTEDLFWILVTRVESDVFADVHLLGKFVSTIVDCGSAITDSANLTSYQKQLFYRHIWHPWDSECQFCGFHLIQGKSDSEFWTSKFETRLQFLNEVTNNEVSSQDIDYYNELIDEAWSCLAQIDSYDSKNKSRGAYTEDSDSDDAKSNTSLLDEQEVVECCRLKCHLEDVLLEVKRIQDPYLRLFARRDVLREESTSFLLDQTLQVGSAPPFQEVQFAAQTN